MKQWIKKWSPVWQPLMVSNLSVYAASACYYMVLSLVPGALLLFSVLSLLPNIGKYDAIIRMLLPDYFSEIIKPLEQIRTQTPIGLISVSGIVAIWSASKSVLTIRTGLNTVMEYLSTESFLKKRLRAMLMLLLLFLLFLGILSLALLGEGILTQIHASGITFPHWIHVLIRYRAVYMMMVFSAALSGVYAILPGYRLSMKYCLTGGCLSSGICLAFSYIFTIYVNQISNYRNLYGILGITILGMIWVRICVSVVFYIGRFIFIRQKYQYHPFKLIRRIISSK